MDNFIRDYRVRKSFTFGLYDAEIDIALVENLISTRALYSYIDEEFNLTRIKDGNLETTKIEINVADYKIDATYSIDGLEIDDFEKKFIAHIVGEKLFRNYFFSKDEEYNDKYKYFIFQPFIINLEKNSEYNYIIYPVVKIYNKEIVIVDFNYYPSEKSETVEEFATKILRIGDEVRELKLPFSYFSAMKIKVDEKKGEVFNFESNEEIVFNSSEIDIKNIFELAELFLNLMFKHEKQSWFGRTVISLDKTDMTNEQIQHIKNGFKYVETNPLYDEKLINFSEHIESKFYAFGNIILTLGDVVDSYLPAAIIDEELSIINTKMIIYSNSMEDASLEELLESKKQMQLIKKQIIYKYLSILKVKTIMEYSINELFKINDQISLIDDLAEISFRQKDYIKEEKNKAFNFLIGLVSVILSMSVIFDYIIVPIYEIRFNHNITPIDTLINYGTLIVINIIILLLFYYFKLKKKK